MSDETMQDDDFGIFEENVAKANNVSPSGSDGDINNVLLSRSSDAESQYITFTIGKEEYGTPILSVQELRGWMKTTPLPNTPSYVRGMTNLRGNIVPVFDMRARFCGEITEVTPRHVVIMVEVDGRIIGLLVDAISDILKIDQSEIQPPPTRNLTVDTQYLDGLVNAGERMVALVNIIKLFDSAEIENMTNQNIAMTLGDN